jgi:hypothetical protein
MSPPWTGQTLLNHTNMRSRKVSTTTIIIIIIIIGFSSQQSNDDFIHLINTLPEHVLFLNMLGFNEC